MDDPICPVCGGNCSEYVFDINMDIVGCDRCTSTRIAIEYNAEQDELEADFYRELFGRDE